MTGGTDFERRFGAGLRAALDASDGPHPVWADSPAAARIAAGAAAARRPWRASRLLAVAALLLIGGAAIALVGMLQRDDDAIGSGCPTLDDIADSSAQPTPPRGRASDVSFPPVAPQASATTGIHPVGTWIVVRDERGLAYQMRVRDVRACDRLPAQRSFYQDGSFLLANLDVQQLRAYALGPWVGPDGHLVGTLGDPPMGLMPPELPWGVPGVDRSSTLSPPEGFALSTMFVVDLPSTAAAVRLQFADDQGGPVEPAVGWFLRDGTDTHEWARRPLPLPGATPTTGELPIDGLATIVDPRTDARVVAGVRDVQTVDGYPAVDPPGDGVILEAAIDLYAWPPGVEPSWDVPGAETTGWRWIASDAEGQVLTNVGDDRPSNELAGAVPFGLAPSDGQSGLLAFVAPRDGPVRLALTLDGAEVASWSLRD